MESLFEYVIKELKVQEQKSTLEELLAAGHINGFNNLLLSHFIIKNPYNISLPNFIPGTDHKILINECIIYLLKIKMFNNVITHGYHLAKNEQVNSVLHCSWVNSSVQIIKGTVWKILHGLLGDSKFVNILINCTVINVTESTYKQIIGNRINEPHRPPLWAVNVTNPDNSINQVYSPVSMKGIMYKNYLEYRHYDIIPRKFTVNELRDSVFDPSFITLDKSMKKRVDIILKKLKINHKCSVKYMKIFNNICSYIEENPALSHLDRKTPLTKVIRFLIVILEKLLPIEFYGSKKNKSILFSSFSKLTSLPLHSSIPFSDIIYGLKITDFSWLLPRNLLSLQDFKKSTLVIHYMISWVFRYLVPRILKTFFYSTNISSGLDIIFFRHDIWNSMSLPFLEDYFQKNLIENHLCRNHTSYLLSDFNHSQLRVIPKKASYEFRALAIPRKGIDSEDFIAYADNNNSIMVPTKSILHYLRNKRTTFFDKIHSVFEISDYIFKFKLNLLQKYKALPKLFFMKFDIESCYDSIPRQKIMNLIIGLLKNENGFHVRLQTFYNLEKETLQTKHVVNGSRVPQKHEIHIDKVKTTYFQNEDILKILDMELFKTSILFDNKCYLRKDGIFQGSSLSALLVDLIYDDLLENYKVFYPKQGVDSLVLRLADDFLLITTDSNQVKELRDICLIGFKEYNATVKKEKIVITSSELELGQSIQFCALQICPYSLEVWKNSDTFNIPIWNLGSSKKIYKRLRTLLKARLKFGSNFGLTSTEIILKQIANVITSIAITFKNAFKTKNIDKSEFMSFLRYIYKIVSHFYSSRFRSATANSKVRVIIIDTFLEILLKHKIRYNNTISCLYQEKSTYVTIYTK